MRGGGRGCACDYGEEEFNSVGGGKGEEDESRQHIYQMHSLSEEAYYTYNRQYKELPRGTDQGPPAVVWAPKISPIPQWS